MVSKMGMHAGEIGSIESRKMRKVKKIGIIRKYTG